VAAAWAPGASASSIGPLRYGPIDHASPHQHIAHSGSRRRASTNERRASSGANEYISRTPWSKYACASGTRVDTGQVKLPRMPE
jgi:hypothetical protein